MPSKKKMAKMPAEAPKAAPMGPLLEARVVRWVFPFLFVLFFLFEIEGDLLVLLHPEESAGGVLAELELGDLVAVRGIGVSFRAVFPPGDRFFEAHT